MRRTGIAVRRLALAALGVLASVRLASAQCPDGTPPPCGRAARAAAPANAVAVLYFDVRSADSRDSALADGLTDAIIDELGANARLRVASRFAVRRYRGAALPEPAILGRTLGVGSLVTGVLQRADDVVQVRIELVAAATGRQMWREPYEGGALNALALQRDIAQRVAASVGGRLTGGRTTPSAPTTDTAAYAAYLRGNGLLPQRTVRTLRGAIAEYERAVTADPRLVSAWARMGIAYAIRLEWVDNAAARDPDTLVAAGMRAADRAVAVGPTSAEAWLARAMMLEYRNPRTFEGVEAAFDRVFALAPRYAEGWQQYADYLRKVGKPGRREALLKAIAYEPGRPITLAHLAGEHDDAMALLLLDSAIALSPTTPGYYGSRALRALAIRHDTAAAVRDLETDIALLRADGRDPWDVEVTLALVRGDSAAAVAAARAAVLRYGAEPTLQSAEGAALADRAAHLLGDRDAAVDALRRIRPQGVALYHVLSGPTLASLRDDARVNALLDASRPPWETAR